MTFDQSVLSWCIVAPALIAILAVAMGRLLERKSAAGSHRHRLALLCYAMGWWAAVVIALSARQGWQWWPSQAWRQGIWPVFGWAILSVVADDPWDRPWRWLVAGLLAAWTAMIAMPIGEAWEDTYHLHRLWMAVITSSCLLNCWSIDRMARRGADRWVLLVALAGLAGAIALAASTYASLAEWAIAAAVATCVYAIVAASSTMSRLGGVAFPIIALTASVIAAGRFQSFEDHPWWLYLAMLFLPSLVGAVDYLIGRRGVWIRVATAAVIATVVAGTSVWWLLLRVTESW